MIPYLHLLLLLALTACTVRQPQAVSIPHRPTPEPPVPGSLPLAPTPGKPLPPPSPPQKKLPLGYHNTTRDGIRMHLVSFDDRDHTLQVADQPNGPGTRWKTAQQVASAHNAIAAINGGFFTPEGKPLGILVTSGVKRGHLNRSSLGAGIYLTSPTQTAIIRRETYQKSRSDRQPTQLLQTGPMLAENHQAITGLAKNNPRPRSFIAWDGQHHWAIGYAEPCSLHALSRALANRTPAGFEIHTALNLDGGRSSDLWTGNKSLRSIFNKPVRNYLVLKAR